jgi:DNA replication protein DnaC
MNRAADYLDAFKVLEELTGDCPEHGQFRRFRTARGEFGRCEPCKEAEIKKAEAEARERARAERVEWLLATSKLPERFVRKDFDNYNASTAGQKKALAECRKYVADLRPRIEAGSCLVLIGPPGVGKTHLLAATVRAAIHSLFDSRYSTMTGFLWQRSKAHGLGMARSWGATSPARGCLS